MPFKFLSGEVKEIEIYCQSQQVSHCQPKIKTVDNFNNKSLIVLEDEYNFFMNNCVT